MIRFRLFDRTDKGKSISYFDGGYLPSVSRRISSEIGCSFYGFNFFLSIFGAVKPSETDRESRMHDRLHQRATGQFDEFCFCNISQYQFP